MVWIHGGGFAYGNGTIKEETGEQFLMEKEIVLVSINYRLNVFGFLSLDIPEAAGNMGLKDQVMALKWVQNNIQQFGGDKNNVTLFGISAGSACIEYLILSPKSKGLFHKAILQSGSSLNYWALTSKHKSVAYKLARKLGFQGDKENNYDIYNYINKHSTDDIQRNAPNNLNFEQNSCMDFAFTPCVEKDFNDNEAFLTEHPYVMLRQGNINVTTILRGFCDSEGMLSVILDSVDVKALKETKNFIKFWPFSIAEHYNEKLKNAYINDISIKKEDDYLLNFFSDFYYISGIWISALLMADIVPIYMYELSYNGEVNFMKKIFGRKDKGFYHHDETSYIFKIPFREPKSQDDKLFSDRLITMWTNFASSG